ncbi:unnamed protein product [Durusdinium trenchii]|uniref:RNase H type-1 domain-containing protein n=1 Tax=Durusdinium trenchii TaxID=1381693 RepID=A0ABP0HFM6_9DINO
MKAAEVSSLQQKWLNEERKLRGLSIADTKREKRDLERSLETMWNEQGLARSAAKISKKELRETENDMSVGGMRNPDLAVERLTLVRETGAKLRAEWEKIYAEEPDFAEVGTTYGSREAKLDEDLCKRWKERLLATLGGPAQMEGILLQANTEYKSPLDLWHAWQVASKDPDLCLQQFIREGVPLRMSSKIPPSGGVFPPARNQEIQSVEAQVEFEECQNMVNYSSVQEHPREAEEEISRPKVGLVAVKRLGAALNWLIAVSNGFKLQARIMWLKEKPAEWGIISDASPMGLGTILWKKNAETGRIQIIEAYEAPFTPEEAYAILRAVKLWQRRIQCKGLILKSDSSVALGIAKKLSSPSPSLNYIAAELACLLDTIDARRGGVLMLGSHDGPSNPVGRRPLGGDPAAVARRPLHAFGMGGNPHLGLRSGLEIVNMVARVAAQPAGGGRGRRVRSEQEETMAQQRRQREETSFESEVGVPASAARVGSTTPQAFTCTMGRSRHNFITTEASLSVRGCSSWVPNSIRGNDNVRGGNARGGSGKEIQEPNDRAKPSRVDERSDGRGHLVSVQPRRNEGEILEDEETGRRVGPDARARESKAAMTIEDAVARAQSKSWVKATANRFVIKFHATSTWLSKRSKRRKIGQLLNVIGLEGPPANIDEVKQEKKRKRSEQPHEVQPEPENIANHIMPLEPPIDKSQLFAVFTSAKGKVRHTVANAGWGIPLDKWKTTCGWPFARYHVRVVLTKYKTGKAKECMKRRDLEAGRDKVRGGWKLAQSIDL